MNYDNDVTIIICTKNRVDSLALILDYHRSCDFQGFIIVADGSDEQKAVAGHFSSTRMLQLDCRGLNIEESYLNAVREAKTKYVAYCGDDDFLLRSGLQQCVRFMSEHPDYAGCTAVSGYLNLSQRGVAFDQVLPYRTDEYSDERASHRLSKMLFSHSAPWFLIRTELIEKSLSASASFGIPRAREKYLLFSTLCQGKVKRLLNCVYVIRGVHSDSFCYPDDPVDSDPEVRRVVLKTLENHSIELTSADELVELHCKNNYKGQPLPILDRSQSARVAGFRHHKILLRIWDLISIIRIKLLLLRHRETKSIRKYHRLFCDQSVF